MVPAAHPVRGDRRGAWGGRARPRVPCSTGSGLPRYPERCRSPLTDQVLGVYDTDVDAGITAYRKALDAGGVEPPDIPPPGLRHRRSPQGSGVTRTTD